MNERYKEMLDSVSAPMQKLGVNDRVLLVDSLNTFIRSFAVIRHLNPNLVPIGGLTGYLRSVGYAINLVRPSRVILVFDGKGSSTNKRYIYPEYKANRGISRITNWDVFESQQDESDALRNQVVRLIDYLKCLPVDLIMIDKIEADDVIGYLCGKFQKDVTVMSSDKDYLQLVSDRVTVYSPTKKIFYTEDLILKEFGVTSNNFLMQKMLLGDSGDNVPGVSKLGPKTLLKEFPELGNNTIFTLQEVLEKCKLGTKQIHQNIINFKKQLELNKLLMDLRDPNIPDGDKVVIQEVIDNPTKGFNSQEFVKLYNEDQLGNSISNLQNWLFSHFHELSKTN
jgi:DNA polymerase-1